MREERTLKICANFYITGDKLCALSKLESFDKAWVWNCFDENKLKILCARFVSNEGFENFQKEFENAYLINKEIFANEHLITFTEKKMTDNASSNINTNNSSIFGDLMANPDIQSNSINLFKAQRQNKSDIQNFKNLRANCPNF